MADVRTIRDMHGRVTSKCVMSDCGLYRYRLERRWDPSLPAAGFALCNPSTADAFVDDATMRKCVGFAKRWGCGGIVIVNVCAFRSPNPEALLPATDPVGPDNREALQQLAEDWHHYHANKHDPESTAADGVSVIVAGWGGALPKRLEEHAETALGWLIGADVHCLGRTKADRPRHPLMLPYDTELEVYVRRKAA